MKQLFCHVTRWYIDMDPHCDVQSDALKLRAHAATDQPYPCELRFLSKEESKLAAVECLHVAKLNQKPSYLSAIEESMSEKVKLDETFGLFQYSVHERDGKPFFGITLPTSGPVLMFLIERSSAVCMSTQLLVSVGELFDDAIAEKSFTLVEDWKVWQVSEPSHSRREK